MNQKADVLYLFIFLFKIDSPISILRVNLSDYNLFCKKVNKDLKTACLDNQIFRPKSLEISESIFGTAQMLEGKKMKIFN